MITFSSDPGLIFVHDNEPGAHATLFHAATKARLAFAPETCSFDDARHHYTWAFHTVGKLKTGDRYVFAVADRDAVAEVTPSGTVRGVESKASVVRSAEGKPLNLA